MPSGEQRISATEEGQTLHKRVLIANRGEIAIRVAKAASALGMESVGVYAPADSLSLHARFTTEARRIGHDDGDPLAAYLDAQAIVNAAVESGCDCIHPGYGFLSENPRMAELTADAGLGFIGPSPGVLALFGDKVRARELARDQGIPVIAGSDAPLAAPGAAAELAEGLGYPVMLKACAGGGGRGMRSVDSADDIEAAFESCRREAESAFGDGRLFVERLLSRPRHIEVQVLADTGGNVVHLHERDCSIQRRNQKVIEVAPAPALDDSLRNKLLGDAVRLVRAAGYVNAGTVEFLVVPETGEYYFIECNPAHPGRTHRHRTGDWNRHRRSAVPGRRWQVASRAWYRRPASGRGDPRVRGPGSRRHPGRRHDLRLQGAVRTRCSGRRLRLRRLRAAAPVRSAARESRRRVELIGVFRVGRGPHAPRAG